MPPIRSHFKAFYSKPLYGLLFEALNKGLLFEVLNKGLLFEALNKGLLFEHLYKGGRKPFLRPSIQSPLESLLFVAH